jgi:ribosomal protein L24E
MSRGRRITVLVTISLVAVVAFVGSAQAVVPLNCGGFDERTATDKLPRPGVVTRVDFGFDTVAYFEYTIDNDGHLEPIFISSLDLSIPVVATWENGTSCSGSEISRNAWAVTPTGRVYSSSDFSGPIAGHYGDMAGKTLNRPVVGMSPTSSGKGYWLVASDGGIFSFGDARFHGSTGNINLNKPIVGISVTPTGKGYWMVASDGGIFAFGDAKFYGSTGRLKLTRPIEGMTATPSGHGYWMVASDGGIFAFGDAKFHGSTGGRNLSAPIAGMVPNGKGYTLIGQDGQLYPFA